MSIGPDVGIGLSQRMCRSAVPGGTGGGDTGGGDTGGGDTGDGTGVAGGSVAGGVAYSTGQTLSTPALDVVDSPFVAASYWVRYATEDDRSNAYIFVSDPNDQFLTWASCWGGGPDDGRFATALGDSANGYVEKLIGDAPVSAGEWHHFLIAFKGDEANNRSILKAFHNRVEIGTIRYDSGLAFSPNLAGFLFCVGSDASNTVANFDMADFWFSVGHDLFEADGTISSATLDKFITADLKPVALGANGELPTGAVPAVYMHRDPAGDAASFATNLGSGGDFTLDGTLAPSA